MIWLATIWPGVKLMLDTNDVEPDGRTDTQFSGVSGGRLVYGIRTAAGGVVMITDPLKGTATHSGWTAGLDSAGATITATFNTRRQADLAVEHLVQEHGIERTNIFVVAEGPENSAGNSVGGVDAEQSGGI